MNANLNGFCLNESPHKIIPSAVLIKLTPHSLTSFSIILVLHLWVKLAFSTLNNTVIQSAHHWKQRKTEHLQLLAELDWLNIWNFYSTVEVSILGHYLPDSVNALGDLVSFMNHDNNYFIILNSQSYSYSEWNGKSINFCFSEHIFGSSCKEWSANLDWLELPGLYDYCIVLMYVCMQLMFSLTCPQGLLIQGFTCFVVVVHVHHNQDTR